MSLLPFQVVSKKNSSSPRWFAGISVSSNGRRIESAMIGVHGRGSGAPIEIRKAISFDLPPEITESYTELQAQITADSDRDAEKSGDFFSLYHHVSRELASVEEEAIGELVDEARLPKSEILAVGIHDSGVFRETSSGLFYQSLCDAPYLAEQTGLNIIDAFPGLDIASNGRGGPILSLPTWIFLKSDSVDRVLIDLGATARIQFLPRTENAFTYQQIRYQDVVPCGSLLDALTGQLTQGHRSIDLGGRLTVQGCQIPKLLSDFRNLALPEHLWNPYGLPVASFLDTVSRWNASEYSSQDVLCTATCFIGEKVAEAVRNMLAACSSGEAKEPEILITGSARMHGMLMNVLSTQLSNQPSSLSSKRSLTPITQLGFPTETFDAIGTAMLTLMAADHIPSNIPGLTGSETSKSLGRISPGSLSAWHRLLGEMAQAKPVARPLRSAV